MKKLLSIIVPSYNMERLLPRCIDSVLRSPSLADIEIVIVNDGSRDYTLRTARMYAERHSDSIVVIDKPNGNYGSTINAALPVVRGEYVRILDADDCFDGGRIGEYTAQLRRIEGVDMIVSPFVEIEGKHYRKVGYDIYSRKPYKSGKVYDAERVFADGAIRFFMMHSVAYRTQMLREMEYRQTEGISYTDQEWVFYPLFNVRRIAFIDIPLYRYMLGREGQTMDIAVQMRSLGQLVQVTAAMAGYFAGNSRSLSAERTNFLRDIIIGRLRIVYRKYLLEMPAGMFIKSDFAKVDSSLTDLAMRCGIDRFTVPVNNLLRFDLLPRWRRRDRRHSSVVLWLLRTADSMMVRIHALLFR